MGVSKNLRYPEMDGENNGKPYVLMDDLEGKTPYIHHKYHFSFWGLSPGWGSCFWHWSCQFCPTFLQAVQYTVVLPLQHCLNYAQKYIYIEKQLYLYPIEHQYLYIIYILYIYSTHVCVILLLFQQPQTPSTSLHPGSFETLPGRIQLWVASGSLTHRWCFVAT